MEELKDKLKKYKTPTLWKMLNKLKPLNSSEDDITIIKSTSNTKAFKKQQNKWPIPQKGNETIVEGELSIIEEDQKVVTVSQNNTNKNKTIKSSHQEQGLSSQILPLHRLSLSSSGSPPNDDHNANKSSPVKEKFQKIRQSLPPLLHYFHDLQMNEDEMCSNEEPTLLNTPKSVSSLNNNNNALSKSKKARNLFKEMEQDNSINDKYENLPPITITDM